MPISGQLPIKVSHPDKIFWPDEGYTKFDLIQFYRSVFPRLAPLLRDRMLMLERCPEGIRGECFFQKEAPKNLPPGTPITRIKHEKRAVNIVHPDVVEVTMHPVEPSGHPSAPPTRERRCAASGSDPDSPGSGFSIPPGSRTILLTICFWEKAQDSWL